MLAAELPHAKGRYIVSHRASADPAFISRTLRERFPQFAIPDGEALPAEETIDNGKAERRVPRAAAAHRPRSLHARRKAARGRRAGSWGCT